MFLISAFHPSFVHKSTIRPFQRNTEFRVHCVVRVSLLQNLDGRNSWHSLQKSLFLCDYQTKSDGVLDEMQIITYGFITPEHIQIN